MTTIYRTCDSSQLEPLTAQGWVIDQTQYEDYVLCGANADPRGVQRRLVFVLRRDDDSALAQALAARDAARIRALTPAVRT